MLNNSKISKQTCKESQKAIWFNMPAPKRTNNLSLQNKISIKWIKPSQDSPLLVVLTSLNPTKLKNNNSNTISNYNNSNSLLRIINQRPILKSSIPRIRKAMIKESKFQIRDLLRLIWTRAGILNPPTKRIALRITAEISHIWMPSISLNSKRAPNSSSKTSSLDPKSLLTPSNFAKPQAADHLLKLSPAIDHKLHQ